MSPRQPERGGASKLSEKNALDAYSESVLDIRQGGVVMATREMFGTRTQPVSVDALGKPAAA